MRLPPAYSLAAAVSLRIGDAPPGIRNLEPLAESLQVEFRITPLP
jgi:hypothetical protein